MSINCDLLFERFPLGIYIFKDYNAFVFSLTWILKCLGFSHFYTNQEYPVIF